MKLQNILGRVCEMSMEKRTYVQNISDNVAHTYVWYALKFAILNYPMYQQWYYSNFINPVIYAYKEKNIYKIDYCEYFDEMNVFSAVLDIELYNNENYVKVSIGDYFRDCLERNIYIEIEIDFYFINGYKKEHFTHPILIYGYTGNVFNVLGFNYNGIFAPFTVSERELIYAYLSAVDINYSDKDMIDKYAYHLLKKKSSIKRFSKDDFIKQLRQYWNGSYLVNTLGKFSNGMNENGKIVTGIATMTELLNVSIEESILRTDYRAFHFWAEHKVKLLAAIKFWSNDLNINGDLIESFRELARRSELLRLRVLRDKVRSQQRSENLFANEMYLHNCLETVNELTDMEYEKLRRILMIES